LRYDDPGTRDALAAEYALGSLPSLARKRFEALTLKRFDWQMAVNLWNARLHLLADTVPALDPPVHVWLGIEKRLFKYNSQAGAVPGQAKWWPTMAIISTGITAAFAIFLVISEPKIIEVPVEVPLEVTVSQLPATVALLSNKDHKPAWMLTLATDDTGQPEIRMTTLAGIKPISDKSYELWILPPNKGAPISVGLLPQAGKHHVAVSQETAELLLQSSLAVTLEPVGGAPGGKATGPVLYKGQLTTI
jgi:anti-sigma-K factor RskA